MLVLRQTGCCSQGMYISGYEIDIPLLVSDTAAGVQFLKGRGVIDKSRIGLLAVSQAKDFTYKVFKGADHSLRVDGSLAEGVFELVEKWLLERGVVSNF